MKRPEIRRPGPVVVLGTLVLTACFVFGTLDASDRPGGNPLHPEGWWGWFDQRQYLKSVVALSRLDFAPGQHWYPLGYPLLAAPFERLLPLHPFLLVDLACLLASFAAFVAFARCCALPTPAAVAAFLLGTLGSSALWASWIVPWTTTPTTAAIWGFLALCARQLAAPAAEPRTRRWRRIAMIGLLCACVPLFRPADLLMPALGLLLMLGWSLRDRSLRAGDPLALLAGAALPLVPYALLYLHIYGAHQTQYMAISRAIGFRFSDLGFKTVVLLIAPQPWFPSGAGLLERLPWMAFGFAGMALLWTAPRGAPRRSLAMLLVMMLAAMTLLFAYADLLPSGLWLYANVHYFTWLMPSFALFGVLFLRAVAFGPRRAAILTLLALVLLSGVRLTPVRSDSAARMLIYATKQPVPWRRAYYNHERLSDRDGTFQNILTMRMLPDRGGLRVISLSRPFRGPLHWQDPSGLATAIEPPPQRWRAKLGFGWPCWLPPYACARLAPR